MKTTAICSLALKTKQAWTCTLFLYYMPREGINSGKRWSRKINNEILEIGAKEGPWIITDERLYLGKGGLLERPSEVAAVILDKVPIHLFHDLNTGKSFDGSGWLRSSPNVTLAIGYKIFL